MKYFICFLFTFFLAPNLYANFTSTSCISTDGTLSKNLNEKSENWSYVQQKVKGFPSFARTFKIGDGIQLVKLDQSKIDGRLGVEKYESLGSTYERWVERVKISRKDGESLFVKTRDELGRPSTAVEYIEKVIICEKFTSNGKRIKSGLTLKGTFLKTEKFKK